MVTRGWLSPSPQMLDSWYCNELARAFAVLSLERVTDSVLAVYLQPLVQVQGACVVLGFSLYLFTVDPLRVCAFVRAPSLGTQVRAVPRLVPCSFPDSPRAVESS
jgi:hypothetical protein